MNPIMQFVGDPSDIVDMLLPSKRDVVRFILCQRSRLNLNNRLPSNDVVLDSVADSLVALYAGRGFTTCLKRNVKRLIYPFKKYSLLHNYAIRYIISEP